MFDLITVGDVDIDTFVPLIDAQVSLLDGERKLILRAGDKVAVDELTSTIGGNSANAAVGGARLKLKVATYTNIGKEIDDHRIVNNFKQEGVDTRFIIRSSEYPSNHHIILDFKGDRTILTYHQPWKYNLPDLETCSWIYFSSLAPSFTKTNLVNQLIAYLERTHAKLLFSPGTFQIKYGIKKYPRLLSLTEVFILNKEEAKLSLGFKEGEKVPVKQLINEIADLGPRLVIITDGEEGSYGFDGEKFLHLGIFPAKVVQKTGAGDAFSIGILAGLFYGKDLSEAMRWGAANASGVIEHIGPQAGLLTYNQLLEKLKENSKIIAKEI